jgi:cellulose biosynthesis protein BcsQ
MIATADLGRFMRYAVWNNKGGVGKTFLSFVLATEIANERKIPVVLVDMCPQANLSESLSGIMLFFDRAF